MTRTTVTSDAETATPAIVLMADSDDGRVGRHSVYMESSGLWVAVQREPGRVLEDVLELRPDAIVTAADFDGQPPGRGVIALLKDRGDTRDIPIVLFTVPSADVRNESRADVCLDPDVRSDVLLQSVRAVLHGRHLQRQATQSRARSPELIARSGELLERTGDLRTPIDDAVRACPSCGASLDWIERGRIGGGEYDYYHWCLKGCGLYCYNRTAKTWLKLA
jgi:hypothetical protein